LQSDARAEPIETRFRRIVHESARPHYERFGRRAKAATPVGASRLAEGGVMHTV
jgi:hypothetical protein